MQICKDAVLDGRGNFYLTLFKSNVPYRLSVNVIVSPLMNPVTL